MHHRSLNQAGPEPSEGKSPFYGQPVRLWSLSPMTLSLFPVFSCGLSQFTCLRLSFPARAFKGSSQVVSSSRKPSWPGKPGQGGLPTLAQFTPRYTRTGCTVIHHFATRTPNIRPWNNRIIISVIISDSFWGQNSGLT